MRKLQFPDVNILDYLEQRTPGLRKKDRGGRVEVTCPWDHEHHSGQGRPNMAIKPSQNCWVCHCHPDGGQFWDLVSELEGLPGYEAEGFDETIRHVCEVMGIEPELRKNAKYDVTDIIYAVYRELNNLLVPIRLSDDHRHIQTDDGARYYRGLNIHRLHSRGIGVFPEGTADRLMDHFGKSKLKAAGLVFRSGNADWLEKGVAIIRRSHNRSPIGVAVRMYEEMAGFSPDMKYLKNSDHAAMRTREYLYGFHEAKQTDAPVIYVVEGELDREALAGRGLKNVVATGNGTLTDEHVKLLAEDDRDIHVVVDGDANLAGQQHAIRMARKFFGEGLRFVLMPGEGVDPDTFVQENGTTAFQNLSFATDLEMSMWGEDLTAGTWTYKEATAQQYMEWVIQHPSAFDQRHISTIAYMSDIDEAVLRNWLFSQRNQQVLNQLSGRSEALQLSIAA